MSKIATREFCNSLRPDVFTSDLNRCPTRSEIEATGLQVVGSYAPTQLVMEKDIRNIVTFVVVGEGGTIIRVQV